MPTYVYACVGCGTFEMQGALDDAYASCPVCHNPARRRPYSGIPHFKGETVARSIPDSMYRAEAEKRDLNRTWGDATRSMEMLRQHAVEDSQGRKQVDLVGLRKDGG